MQRLSIIVVTCWAGALWMTGLTASVLFNALANKQLAGQLAGQLFTLVSYIGLASASFLLFQQLILFGKRAFSNTCFRVVLLMALFILAGHFGVQPILQQLKTQAFPLDVMQSPFAAQFKMWHGVAGVVYLLECILAIFLVLNVHHTK